MTTRIFFLDCLRDAFKESLEEKNLNCTLPWIESMKDKQVNYTEEDIPTCKTSDEYHLLDDFGSEFAIEASAFSHPKCFGINKKILYK